MSCHMRGAAFFASRPMNPVKPLTYPSETAKHQLPHTTKPQTMDTASQFATRLSRLSCQLSPQLTAVLDIEPPKYRAIPKLTSRGIECTVSRAYQEEFHAFASVNSATFGDTVDPSFVSGLISSATLREGNLFRKYLQAQSGGVATPKRSGKQKELRGVVHVSEYIRQLRPLKLGERFIMTPHGDTERIAHPKGDMNRTQYKIVSAHTGEVCIRVDRYGLAIDPELAKAADSAKKANAGTSVVAESVSPTHGKILVRTVQFKPSMVGSYCYGAVNAVHTDPVVAVEFGYEAPIWAGTQGMHICLDYVVCECLKEGGAAEEMNLEVWFKRPVFWHEKVELWFQQHDGKPKGVGDYVLYKPGSGKIAMEMAVYDL